MANPIVLCADSTCDLSPELLEKYHVHLCPLHISYGEESYLDGVNICTEDIYRIYAEKHLLPHTTATNIAEYQDFVRQFTQQGNDVIYITLGSGLSTTYRNCCMAAEDVPGMYVIDSANLSTGMGHVVIETGERIAAGMPVEQIVAEIQAITGHIESSFVLNDLEFLHKGGRCSALSVLGANMLKLKPCIEVNNADGTMSVGKKYRGTLDKALAEYVKDRLDGRTDIDTRRIFITHSGMPAEKVETIRQLVEQYMHFDEVLITVAGCTISSHCGPNTLGILFITK